MIENEGHLKCVLRMESKNLLLTQCRDMLSKERERYNVFVLNVCVSPFGAQKML
jgi:hypothetical protein